MIRALGLFSGVALAVAVNPSHVLRGLLTNETFFRGRPTSYWRKAIKKDTPEVHRAFGVAIGSKPDPAAVPVLTELLDDEDRFVCTWACNALAILGPNAAGAVPTLRELLTHEDVSRRHGAALTLAAIGPAAEDAIPELIGALEEEDAFLNYYAATALGRIGPPARDAVPALLRLCAGEKANEWFLGPAKQGRHVPSIETVGGAADWALSEIDPGRPRLFVRPRPEPPGI